MEPSGSLCYNLADNAIADSKVPSRDNPGFILMGQAPWIFTEGLKVLLINFPDLADGFKDGVTVRLRVG